MRRSSFYFAAAFLSLLAWVVLASSCGGGGALAAPTPPSISVSVSPTTTTVQAGATQQFTATVTGTTDTTVTWSVNDVVGGNSTVGTISASGLYTAPAAVPSPDTVTVKATSVADPSKSASATVTITAPPGGRLWSSRFGSSDYDAGYAIAVDVNGDVLVTGYFQGTVDFGGETLTTAGAEDIFVAKFSGVDGAHLWSERFGGTDNDYGVGIAVDGSANVLVTGYFAGTVNFGGGGLTSAGGYDIFVVKFSGVDGAHLWSKRFGSTDNDGGLGLAADGSGNVLVTGSFQGTVDFDGDVLTSAGLSDIFVLKLWR